jgi:CBS domain containing-hemolysin-like protein
MIEEKEMINEAMVKVIRQKDYSYILVYKEKRNKITGVIKVKELALKYLK